MPRLWIIQRYDRAHWAGGVNPMYQCSKCKLAVIVAGDRIIRACKCGDAAPVVGQMSATVRGSGAVKTA